MTLAKFDEFKKKTRKEHGEGGHPMIQWLLDQHDPSGSFRSYDAAKVPNIVTNIASQPIVIVSDYKVVTDLMTTKNGLLTKSNTVWAALTPLNGDGLFFRPSDAEWKKIRTALAPAFHKKNYQDLL